MKKMVTRRTVDSPIFSVYHAVTMPTARKANGQFKRSKTAAARHRNPAASSDIIVVTARFIDGGGERKTFKTLEGARKYAQSRIGAHPSIGGGYAVDNNGVCTIRVTGTSLQSLFPARGAKPMRRGLHRHECMSPGCDREGRHLAYEGGPEGDLYYCDDCAYQHSYGRVGSPDSSLMPYPEDIGGRFAGER